MVSGINISFRASAAEIAWRPIGANFAACFGVNGRLNWYFGDATFERTAVSFDNPDFVDVVLHHYRHAFGLAGGRSVACTSGRAFRPPPQDHRAERNS